MEKLSESIENDLYLRRVALGEIKGERTGYPSVDKPWLKYYSEEAIQAELPECSLYEYLWQNNREHPKDIALNYFGNKMTYGELFENIDLVARAFAAQGVKAGDVVTIVALSSVPSVLCFYALNKLGAIFNFVNVLASGEDLEEYFKEAGGDVIVSMDVFGEKVLQAANKAHIGKVIMFSLSDYMPMAVKAGFSWKMRGQIKDFSGQKIVLNWKDFLAGAGSGAISFQKDSREVCAWVHTGGTTGFPKTVLLSDNAMNAIASQYKACYAHKRQEVFLNVMILYVVYGLLVCMHMPLCLGFSVVIIPKFDASDWKNYFKKYHPNHIMAIPAYVGALLEQSGLEKNALSGLLTVGVGGDGMTKELEKKLNEFLAGHSAEARILKGYGMTEVSATAVVENRNVCKNGSVGIPFPANNIMIYDNENGKEHKYGEIGEICLRCRSVMLGYRENAEATEHLVRMHEGQAWVHTEDLGYIDEDGFLFIVGRLKRMILLNYAGCAYKVYPQRVEEVLETSDHVKSACVVRMQEKDSTAAKAYIVLRDGAENDRSKVEKALRELCQRELPEYSCPSCYEFIDSLPLTVVGKVDYKALER